MKSVQFRFTLYGCIAILSWSCLLGIARLVTESLGPVGGAAMLYSLSSIFLLIVVGIPKLSYFSSKYLIVGGAMFVCYEIFLALALGYSNSRSQAIEVSIVNYLWPALTVLFAVLGSNKKPNWLLYPAVTLAFIGVAWTVSGDNGLSPTQIISNVSSNPLVYFMAFTGAVIWAVYCNLTQRQQSKHNAITLFFIATAVSLWVKYAFADEPTMTFSWSALGYLFASAALMAGGYGLWNIAIVGGNMVFLATLSYFTPIFSALFSSLILGVTLSNGFWQGVIMVTVGSLLCWLVTKEKREAAG
ncbi:TPA: aromatic amino acid DMT transporter YddG [Vibrio parahaemolyticus]|uniref:aromatic amino acid DMT transporter YddG n=1 Tax=Vibrio parahaemolyticus TaxID=670 RepID=UPI0007A066A0|nr:aromatic amino acid DMT transporter YddG [Vibrio parahaemolyticus]EGQ8525426.1 aromatic amino acid DMT transporter YddG [Vibrio parahaemolyticus]EGQ9209951.1 drug/metabolite DMT transporter permease [Vibrio parahaemolyticus]EGQ9786445.1 drug/metabolite DMT transporter permease [Vibrio parahaemolyticus]EGQ9923412.1 drug/metabolite DMT transporter permease [Vibrio parahaemolyticus]EGR0120656.1 drug/metabolite DMT transporter permease [Vibrio parahaemolyticus]